MKKEQLEEAVAKRKATIPALEAPIAPIAATPPVKKVAILGFTESWRLAPFDDESWEIWGLNELYITIPRWTRWFEIHDRAVYEADKKRVSDHVQRLMAMECPIYMQRHWDDIPSSIEYPLNALAQMFPNPTPGAKPYLTNTITYMILLAIAEGFQEIKLCGVNMSHDCIAPEMRVLTADLRWVPAGDLRVGQELIAFDDEIPIRRSRDDEEPAQFRKYRKTRVESMSELTRPCHRVEMADGTTLISSIGHKWLALGGRTRHWMQTDQLNAGDGHPEYMSHIVKLLEPWEEDRSWAAGYLAAALDGEGHLTQTKRTNCSSTGMVMGFSQRPNAMSAEVENCLAALKFQSGSNLSADGCAKYNVKGGRSELLRLLGQVRPRRLLAKFDRDAIGTLNSIDNVAVERSEYIGEQRVIGLTTTTGTLIVEGFASHNSEYAQQRPSCEWAVGLAQGRGINVWIPMESDLMKTVYLYGYEEEQANAFDAKLVSRKKELQDRLNGLDAQMNNLNAAREQHRGALQDAEHLHKIWRSTPH